MSVIRVEKTKDYTVMSNSHLKNKEMSLKAKGLLSLMLSLPDEWDYTVEGLTTLSADGKDGVRATLKELEKLGYLRRTQTKANGKFGKSEYTVYELPQSTNPLTENPTSEKPISEKPTQLNTNISNTKELNTNNKVSKKTKSYDEIIAGYTQNESLKNSLVEFVKMRSMNKRQPLTSYGLSKLLNKLDKLGRSDAEKVEIVDQSVMRGWAGFFEVKEDKKQYASQPEEQHEYFDLDEQAAIQWGER